MRAVDRRREGRVRHRIAGRPARTLVLAEEILRAIGRRHDPVAVVVGAVPGVGGGAGQVLDAVAVVLLLVPGARPVVEHQLRRRAVQAHRHCLTAPAIVELTGDRALGIVGAVGVGTLDIAVRGQREALADHPELVVGRGHPAVHAGRVVAERHRGSRARGRIGHRDRIGPGEVTRRPSGSPRARRRQRGHGEVTVAAGRAGHRRQNYRLPGRRRHEPGAWTSGGWQAGRAQPDRAGNQLPPRLQLRVHRTLPPAPGLAGSRQRARRQLHQVQPVSEVTASRGRELRVVKRHVREPAAKSG